MYKYLRINETQKLLNLGKYTIFAYVTVYVRWLLASTAVCVK